MAHLLVTFQSRVDAVDANFCTPLVCFLKRLDDPAYPYAAGADERFEMFELLVRRMTPVDINQRQRVVPVHPNGELGQTALMYAARLRDARYICALLVAGAQPDLEFTRTREKILTAADIGLDKVSLILRYAIAMKHKGQAEYQAFLQLLRRKLAQSKQPKTPEELEVIRMEEEKGKDDTSRERKREIKAQLRQRMEALPADSFYNWSFTSLHKE